jgi:S1-C subfamily serine protease
MPIQLVAGEEATVKAEVTNEGQIEGVYTAVLKIDGKTVATKEVKVAPGSKQTVSLSWPLTAAGEHTIDLGGQTMTLKVLPSAQSRFQKGTDLLKAGELDQAIVELTAAIALDPKNASAYYNRGIAYRKKGELDKAISDYNKAIELDPKYAWAYNNRGNAYVDKDELDKAISDYNKAIELDPKYPKAYNNRGVAYLKKGELDKAISDYNKAIELDPKYALAYNNRNNAYAKKGEPDKAITDFKKAIELDPKYATVANAVDKVAPALVRVKVEDGEGSGMIIDKQGYVLTNNHVVWMLESATVILSDRTELEGQVVGRDEAKDIAIIKVDKGDLPVVKLIDSDRLELGDDIVVVGFPLAIEGDPTISKGIVSAFRNDEDRGATYIQTDAAINPGQSGGPLITLRGEVVGINSWKYIGIGLEGLNFAIATNSVVPILSRVMGGETIPAPMVTYTNKEAGYSILYPASWYLDDADPTEVLVTTPTEDARIIMSNSGENVLEGYTIADFAYAVLEYWRVIYPDLEERSVIWLDTNEGSLPVVKFTVTLNGGKRHNRILLMPLANGDVLSMQCMTQRSKWDVYSAVFQETMQSVDLIAK